MIKQLFLPLAGVAAFIVFVGLLVKDPSKFGFVKPSPAPIQKTIKIAEKSIKIELADTPEKRSRGLSGRSLLEENSGMFFTFDSKDTFPSFWMKDMAIPIDIIWINDDKIVKIDKNVPVPIAGAKDSDLKLYRPDKPIDYVLEVNAGFADKNSITVGQSLSGL